MRHTGLVPGVLYGGGEGVLSFAVDARVLRAALAARGAVLELSIDGGRPTPAVLKAAQRHVVRGDMLHVDLVRVRLDQAIQAMIPVTLVGGDDSPGVKEGGVLELVTHHIEVEALPTSIPEGISHDVSEMSIGDTLLLSEFEAPEGVTLLGELSEIVIATLSPPRLRLDEETEIETETGVVGEAGADADTEEGAGEPSGRDDE
jgi:large subunit ribosomal protein L25